MTDQAPNGSIIEAITEYYGPRCDDSMDGCPCCDVWAEFDRLTSTSDALIAQARAEGRREGRIEGLEEAISHVRDNSMSSMAAEKSIRALIDKDKT